MWHENCTCGRLRSRKPHVTCTASVSATIATSPRKSRLSQPRQAVVTATCHDGADGVRTSRFWYVRLPVAVVLLSFITPSHTQLVLQVTLLDLQYPKAPSVPVRFPTHQTTLDWAFRSAQRAINKREDLHLIEQGHDALAFLAPGRRTRPKTTAYICRLLAYNVLTGEPRDVSVKIVE